VRYAWIDEYRDQFDVARMCRQLEVSRTGFYQWRKRPTSPRVRADSLLDAHVAALHAQHRRRYGRPRAALLAALIGCKAPTKLTKPSKGRFSP
jgi:hypothetical protein